MFNVYSTVLKTFTIGGVFIRCMKYRSGPRKQFHAGFRISPINLSWISLQRLTADKLILRLENISTFAHKQNTLLIYSTDCLKLNSTEQQRKYMNQGSKKYELELQEHNKELALKFMHY